MASFTFIAVSVAFLAAGVTAAPCDSFNIFRRAHPTHSEVKECFEVRRLCDRRPLTVLEVALGGVK